ncbi:hypothetical protein HID58_088332, partial [Brassica napus]
EHDFRLPPRLFVTDRFPTRSLNIYSSPEIIPFIRHVLDTPKFETIRQSCFGKLFDLLARKYLVSCKLIHGRLATFHSSYGFSGLYNNRTSPTGGHSDDHY